MTANSEQGVLDAIDALIDDQLAEGEPETGFAFGDPGFPRCRCGKTWHGLATRACPGSDVEGPLRPRGRPFAVRELVRCRCGGPVHVGPLYGCPGTAMEGPVDLHGAMRAVTEQWAEVVMAMRPVFDAFRGVAESIERSFRLTVEAGRGRGASPQMTIVDEMRPVLDVPSHPSELRVQVPRPATTPPMWAVDPTRSRRRRTHQ